MTPHCSMRRPGVVGRSFTSPFEPRVYIYIHIYKYIYIYRQWHLINEYANVLIFPRTSRGEMCEDFFGVVGVAFCNLDEVTT